MDKKYKFYLEAKLAPIEETISLRKEVASVIDLPQEKDRQPDLSYFSSIFVSTGTNLNDAHFLPSELVAAEETIVGKAVDIEHEEDQIIGHIYASEFTDKEGKKLDVTTLKNQEIASLDEQGMHVEIASVIYKTRFPEISKEIKDGNWMVSMEAYYTSYDVLIGNTILTQDEAMALGFDCADDSLYGSDAKIVKAGETVDEGKLARVLRGICFSGVGVVKNPANPPSVVLDATASKNKEGMVILNYDLLEKSNINNVTIPTIEEVKKEEKSELQYDDTVGLCVNYHKEVNDSVVKDQDSKVMYSNWCSKYDTNCTTSGDATGEKCLRNTVTANIKKLVEERLEAVYKNNKIDMLTKNLVTILKKQNN